MKFISSYPIIRLYIFIRIPSSCRSTIEIFMTVPQGNGVSFFGSTIHTIKLSSLIFSMFIFLLYFIRVKFKIFSVGKFRMTALLSHFKYIVRIIDEMKFISNCPVTRLYTFIRIPSSCRSSIKIFMIKP